MVVDHPSVLQVIQIAPEATPGSAVPASKRLRSMRVTFQPQANIDEFIPSGYKYPVLTAMNQEWMAAQYEGEPTYQEIIYPFSSIINGATATVGGTTASGTAYVWNFSSLTTALDTKQTYTVERGDANAARRFPHGQFNSITMDISRTDTAINGDMIGHRLETGIALSGTAVELPLTPILGNQFKLYLEDSQAALGTAVALDRAFNLNISIGPRHTPIWPINSDYASFATTVESQAPGLQVQLTLGAGTVGFDDMVDVMRNGQRKFLRAEAIGGSIAGTSNYKFTFDYAGEVISAPTMEDMEEVGVAQWTLRGVHDQTWSRAYQVIVVNNIASY